ncbi:ABC transporter permease subunit [Paenibacillus taichungensis]|uniref:ABC transporter permease n=1 Tax=Paenibacillus TaxID=44249 RepID=UPI0021165514|nr:ABC transporter permease subunit [Paenibacillus taichungensis]MEC0111193.1 ABC transporter permease subunit [Paenibacillus taichungensis]MEC0200855.1 ABC transporter permease subunit [Paenibacillus taichungensis]
MTNSEKLRRRIRIRDNVPLYTMLVLPLLFFIIFCYVPMFGIVIAFKDYRFIDGIMGSDWVGLRNFKMIFSQPGTLEVIRNTFVISLLTLVVSFPFPIILAVLLNEIRIKWFKKASQTILYLPHFFSWIIVGGIIINVFSINHGPINFIIEALGGTPFQFMFDHTAWMSIYLGAGVWKDTGFNTIIYLAALSSIDPTYYEAAVVDGANKWKQITKITIPSLIPVIVLQFILATGKIMEVGFDRIYVLQNPMVRDISEVVSTFIYDVGIRSGDFSLTTAMGLFDSVIGLILVLLANQIAKKSDNALF